MGLKSLAAFASLSGLVFLGGDYEQQARRAGLGLGELSAGGYVDSFRARFAGVQEAQRLAALEQERQQRWNVGGKAFLPEALEGMERFSLPERLDLFTEDIVEQSKEEEEADRLDELDQALSEIRLQRWAQRQDASSWGYIKNDEVLVLSISLRGKVNPNSLSGMIVSAMSNVSLPGKPFAVIGGVAYGREGGIGHSERRMKRYQGTMGLGERAIITLDAVASEETIRSLLAAIDYDGLNSLFLKPEETVGNDVVVPSDAEAELAEAIYDLRDEMRQISSKAVRLKMQGIDPARLVASAMTGSGIPLTGAVGGADITDQIKIQIWWRINNQ